MHERGFNIKIIAGRGRNWNFCCRGKATSFSPRNLLRETSRFSLSRARGRGLPFLITGWLELPLLLLLRFAVFSFNCAVRKLWLEGKLLIIFLSRVFRFFCVTKSIRVLKKKSLIYFYNYYFCFMKYLEIVNNWF